MQDQDAGRTRTLRLKIAQKPCAVWSLGPKALEDQSFRALEEALRQETWFANPTSDLQPKSADRTVTRGARTRNSESQVLSLLGIVVKPWPTRFLRKPISPNSSCKPKPYSFSTPLRVVSLQPPKTLKRPDP